MTTSTILRDRRFAECIGAFFPAVSAKEDIATMAKEVGEIVSHDLYRSPKREPPCTSAGMCVLAENRLRDQWNKANRQLRSLLWMELGRAPRNRDFV